MARILIITESRSALRTFRASLPGHEIQTATDRTAASAAGAGHRPDLIIVDLPVGARLDHDPHRPPVIPRASDAPIVVTSPVRDHRDIATILDAGADDHITTPFDASEFAARIRAQLRRARPHRTRPTTATRPDRPGIVRTAAFTVDLARQQVIRAGRPVPLTPTEWRILAALARTPRTLITPAQLVAEVRGPGHPTSTAYLRVYLHQLRAKLEPDAARPRHLITEPGLGYRLDP